MQKLAFALLIVVLFASLLPTSLVHAATVDVHIGDQGDGYGFTVFTSSLPATRRNTVLDRVQEARFGWVREEVSWRKLEPMKGNLSPAALASLDDMVDSANARGLRILLSLADAPYWWAGGDEDFGLPTDPADFAAFASFLAQRYQGKVAAYEIWRLQNLAIGTSGVDVAAYLSLLKAAYTAIKGRDPQAVIAFGGMLPNDLPGVGDQPLSDTTYLQRFYALNGGEGKRYYDVLGVMSYPLCNPPDASWPDAPSMIPCDASRGMTRIIDRPNSVYFKRVLDMRAVMEANGEGNKRIWFMQLGWSSWRDEPGRLPLAMGWGARTVTEADQAQYLVRALELAKGWPWVGVVFVDNLNGNTDAPESTRWGAAVLRGDLSPRPAFDALAQINAPVP